MHRLRQSYGEFKASLVELGRFLGRQVLAAMALTGLTGLLLFVTELGMAAVLQSYFHVFGRQPSTPGAPDLQLGSGNQILAWMLAIICVRGVLIWANSFLNALSFELYLFRQRERVTRWVFTQKDVSSARAIALFSELASKSSIGINRIQAITLASTIGVCILCRLIYLSPRISFLALTLVAVVGLPLRRLNRRIRDRSHMGASEWEGLSARILLGLKNLLFVRICGSQGTELEQGRQGLRRYMRSSLGGWLWFGSSQAYVQTSAVLVVCGVSFIATYTGSGPPGGVIGYIYLLYRLLQQGINLSAGIMELSIHCPHLSAMMKWWRESGMTEDPVASGVAPAPSASTRWFSGPVGWSIRGGEFSYPGDPRPVLSGLDLEVRPGSLVVLTGPSGCGKSTLLGLLMGELELSRGEIGLIHDSEVFPLQASRAELVRRVGYVGAESFLMAGTIRDNLSYGAFEPISDEEALAALKAAECDFVLRLPEGLNHWLSDRGEGLSMGQKQRICLARALLRKPLVLFLDEATANLDKETESKLLLLLARLKGKVTIIAASHHPAILVLADDHLDLGPKIREAAA